MLKKISIFLFFSIVWSFSFAAPTILFKKIGTGKEYGEPIYSGRATITGNYEKNYEDYKVMGINNPVCFNLSDQDLKNIPTPITANFCFSNSKQAQNLLHLPKTAKKGCFYQGRATITIKNFSEFSALDPAALDFTLLLSVDKLSEPTISCNK